MLRDNETIPNVNIEYIRKAIQAELNEDGSALEEASLCVGKSMDSWCLGSDVKRRQQV